MQWRSRDPGLLIFGQAIEFGTGDLLTAIDIVELLILSSPHERTLVTAVDAEELRVLSEDTLYVIRVGRVARDASAEFV